MNAKISDIWDESVNIAYSSRHTQSTFR